MLNSFVNCSFELKSTATSQLKEGYIEGYGAVFGNMDFYGDVIKKGAFQKSLTELKSTAQTIPMRVMHAQSDCLPIGVWMEATEDEYGLRLKGKLSGLNTEKGQFIHELVKDGALSGLSIGFYLQNDDYEFKDNIRFIKNANLMEVSLVDTPANAKARITQYKQFHHIQFPEKPFLKPPDLSEVKTALSSFLKAIQI